MTDSEVTEVIILSLQGRASPQEEAGLNAWRERSAANEAQYQSLHAAWVSLEGAGPLFDALPPNVLSIVAEAERRRRFSALRVVTRRAWLRRGAIAATLVGLGFGVSEFVSWVDPSQMMLSKNEIVTGIGEMTTITLGDNTTVRVGPETVLRFRETSNRRLAWVEGRALFAVSSNPARPFVVSTNYGDAEVHGTRFEVRAEQDEFRVLVVEGLVSVIAGGAEVFVSQGQMSRSVEGQPPSTTPVTDIEQQLAWVGNVIVFQSTPLSAAVLELQQGYGIAVRITAAELNDVLVTATFVGMSFEQVLPVLCETIGARCRIDGTRAEIQPSARSRASLSQETSARTPSPGPSGAVNP